MDKKKKNNIIPKYKDSIKRGISWLLKGIIILFIIIFASLLAVNTPFFKNKVISASTNYLSELTGYKITLDDISFNWLDNIKLTKLTIFGLDGNPLIAIGNAEVNLTLSKLYYKSILNFDYVNLEDPEVNLRFFNSDSINIKKFGYDLAKALSTQNSPKNTSNNNAEDQENKFQLIVPKINVMNGKFTYFDYDEQLMEPRYFDYYHINFNKVNANIKYFQVSTDTLIIDVQHLDLKTPNKDLYITDLSTYFTFTFNGMSYDKLHLKTKYSSFNNYLRFEYNDLQELVEFNTKTKLYINFENSIIDSRDLKHFFDFFDKNEMLLKMKGKAYGRVNSFTLNDLLVNNDENSHLLVNGKIDGIPDNNNTRLNLDFDKVKIDGKDLIAFVDINSLNDYNDFKFYDGNGSYDGTLNEYKISFDIDTSLGNIGIDANYHIDSIRNEIRIDGNLVGIDLDIKEIYDTKLDIKQTTLHADFNSSFRNRNYTIDNLYLYADVKIDSILVNKRKYKNIKIKADYKNDSLYAYIDSKDKNLSFEGKTLYNLDSIVSANWDITLTEASLNIIDIFKDREKVDGKIFANFSGTNIDDLEGKISLRDIIMKKKGIETVVDKMDITITKNIDNTKDLNIESSLLDFNAKGVNNIDQLQNHFYNSWNEYKRFFIDDDERIAEYYNSKIFDNQEFKTTFSIFIKNINPLLSFLNSPIKISENSHFEGDVRVTNTAMLNLMGKIDTLRVNSSTFVNNELDFSTSKFNNNSDILSSFQLVSIHQIYDNEYINNTDSLEVFFWLNKNEMEFEAKLLQLETNSSFNLLGKAEKNSSGLNLNIKNSKISLLGDDWTTNDNHNMSLMSEKLVFNDLKIQKQSNNEHIERIALNGTYGKNSSNPLSIIISNVDIGSIGEFFNQEIYGLFNANIVVSKQKYINNLDVDFSILNLEWLDYNIGSILGSVSTPTVDGYKIQSIVRNNNIDNVFVFGNYYPFNEDPLNITVIGNNLPLNYFQHSAKEVINNLEGKLSGEIKINASLDHLEINGKGVIKDGKGILSYLNSQVSFNGPFSLNNKFLGVDSLWLTDNNGNKAFIKGGFKHKDFSNFELDVNGEFNNFTVLDLNKGDNEIFYGKGIGAGTLTINGPLSNFRINANVKTEKNTTITIPITNEYIDYSHDYITFKSNNDTKNKIESTNNTEKVNKNIKNINFDFEMDLEVTPDVNIEVILSENTRDYIKGKAKGNLNFKIDVSNNFTLNGELETVEGEYSFTLQKLFNKQFKILPNSKIKWFGDPYNGTLDIVAKYTQLASLEPLFDESTIQINPDISKKYDTDVLLNLKGKVLQPKIDFDISFEGYPISLSNEVEEVKSRILIDEQEKERQSFSLIALYKFSPYNNFSLSLTSQIGGSLSEILSNQFSHWMSQVDENFEIDINLGKLDQNAFNDLQLRMSYTLLDGRMTVARDGGVTNGQNLANFNSIAGDWSVEYLLYPDGKLKIRVYKKNNYNAITALTNNNVSTGVSFVYTKNFYELKEIWKKSRKKYLENNNQ